jgi:hypothetical protein
MQGGWELYRDNWQNVGGSISTIEFEKDPPKSNYLYQRLGENCGSAFWALINQRLHLLYPARRSMSPKLKSPFITF